MNRDDVVAAAQASLLADIVDQVRAQTALLEQFRVDIASLRTDLRQGRQLPQPDVKPNALLVAIFAVEGDREWTVDELLADAALEAYGAEGEALRRALRTTIGVRPGAANAASKLGTALRDLHGREATGLRLVQASARNRRGVAVWRVVTDVPPATPSTARA